MNKVKELEDKLVNSHQENERLHKEIHLLKASRSHEEYFLIATLEEIRLLQNFMKQLHIEMIILQKIASSLMDVQNELKRKGTLLKETLIVVDLMYE